MLGSCICHQNREKYLVGKVVARPASAAALDEGRRPEVLQARPGAGQQLPAALCTRRRVLKDDREVGRIWST